MDRQTSTTKIVDQDRSEEEGEGEGDSAQTLNTTAISIREEFHCKRSWFFYHDLRAFTTSVSHKLYS